MIFLKKVTKLYFNRGLWISAPQFLSIVVQLVTLPIVLRSIAVDMYGGFQFVSTIFTWVTVFSFGYITLGASRGIAINKLGTFLYAFLYRLRIVVPLGVLLILGSYLFDVSRGVFQQLLYIVGAYLIIGYLPQISFPEFFVARQQFKNYFVWQSVLFILVPIFSATAAFFTHDVRIYALVQFGCISLVSVAVFFWILIRNKIFIAYNNKEIDTGVIKYGLSLFPAEIVSGTSNQLTNFVIGPFFGFVNLAVFSVASRIDSAAKNFLSSVYHIIYADFAKKDFEELRQILRNKNKFFFLLSIIISFFIAIPGFLYIRYALPDLYSKATIFYVILVTGFPAVLLQTILYTFLASHLRHKTLVFTGIFPSIIKILLILGLGFAFGIVGIAVAIALTAWINYAFYYVSVFHKKFLFSLFPRRFQKDAFYKSGDE